MDSSSPSSFHFASPPLTANLRDKLGILRKRKWTVLCLVLSGTVGAALYAFMQPAVYESTVSILVEPFGPQVLARDVQEIYAPTNMGIEYYKTQYEILKSFKILHEVTTSLNLKNHPEYSAKPASPLTSWISDVKAAVIAPLFSLFETPTDQPAPVPQTEAERRLVLAFQGHVRVKPVLNSRIVRVTVESIDPYLAAQAANMIASVYITRSLEMKIGAAEEATKWITIRVEETRRKVEESESALHEYANRYGLINIDERRRLVTQKLIDLNNQLVQVETKRVEADARFKQIASVLNNPRGLESSAEVLNSNLIQSLRNQEIQAGQKLAELSDKYGPKHPAMVRATSELREIQNRIQQEIRKIYVSVKAEYEVAMARERVVRNALNQQKTEVMATGQHEVQYGILEREVQSNRQLYEMFLKRMKETDIAADIRVSNLYVADPAIVSLVPVKPQATFIILVAALISALGGIGFALFLEHMDNTIKSAEDVAQYLPGLAFLGFLPVVGSGSSRHNPHRLALSAHEEPQSIFAEQVRSIRTSLVLSAADKPPRVILVTSSVQEEGKSTFSTSLAISLAQLGHPTVLIDGDLRKPVIHDVFGLKVSRGLSHLLVGEARLQDVLHPASVPNLKVIPCGAIPPNPAELLQAQHMRDLLDFFRKEGAFVVVDCSPILLVADSIIVGHSVDGAILVVRAAHTTRQAVRAAATKLQDANVKLLGIVLQRLKRREIMAHYVTYGKYYKKYYKDTRREQKTPLAKPP